MKPFLLEIAESLHGSQVAPESLTMVFPNRRAIVYFRKYLASLLDQPVFAPRLLTFEDFVAGFSDLKVTDRLALVQKLHQSYRQVTGLEEDFDRFYFWGEMLLRDFDEVDKYMVDAGLLFKDLSRQKELDTSFDFLSEEQIDFLKRFWNNLALKDSEYKERFLAVWRNLHEVYELFRTSLRNDGQAYEGMLQRDVALSLSSSGHALDVTFVGFNALTTAEEAIICHFVRQGGGRVEWDVDAQYVNDHKQEAGIFFRQYQHHEVLGSTFSGDIPSNFQKDKTVMRLYGTPSAAGQTKLLAQVIGEEFENGMDPESTLVVLPDEKLLIPVLHGVSAKVSDLNVTMGYPLAATPGFNLIELLIELQINRRGTAFSHRQVVAILGHPYVVAADAKSALDKMRVIKRENRVYLSREWLTGGHEIHSVIFRVTHAESITGYLKEVMTALAGVEGLSVFDREYVFYFLKLLNRLEDVLSAMPKELRKEEKDERVSMEFFLRLFRQLVRAERIPFSGEPLRGLQIMGVLETRNLDFKNVFILSLNEGVFPSPAGKGSYLPFSLRKAYGLPTVEQHDAIHAYLFYRVLQRAENVFLFYNSETDVLGLGEMSRFLRQLVYESRLPLERFTLHNPVAPRPVEPIRFTKDAPYFRELKKYCDGPGHVYEMTPSALNDYIECSLRFYLRHIARIREAKEVEEALDARMMGILLHDTMEKFYRRIIETKKTNLIETSDLDNYEGVVADIINEVFIDLYKLDGDKPVEYEGQRLIVREVVMRFVDQILKMDRAYTPFLIEGLEMKDLTFSVQLPAGGQRVVLGGRVDRADRKATDTGEILRVIDYKAGKDTVDTDTIGELFARSSRRNKAAFQVLFYATLFRRHFKDPRLRLVPGLINRLNLFDEDFHFGLRVAKKPVDHVDPYLPEFEAGLQSILQEIFDPAVPIEKTPDVESCRFCPYRGICYR